MNWQWVIVIIGLALIYAILFLAALSVVAKVAVTWTRTVIAPYKPDDFEKVLQKSTEHTAEYDTWPGTKPDHPPKNPSN